MSEQHMTNSVEEDEVDLIAIAKTVWEGRSIIIKSIITCSILGLFIALFSSNEYVAKGIFIPQVSDSKGSGGSLSGLAAMAGISLGGGLQSTEISPALYPQVIASTSFCKELMAANIKISGIENEITLFEYLTEFNKESIGSTLFKYTAGLPGVIKAALSSKEESNTIQNFNSNVELLTEEEYKVKNMISEILSLTVDDKAGYVSISAKMPEAYAAAQVAIAAQDLLQKYVTNYKISNAQKDLNFVEERFIDKEKEFYTAQEKLAEYSDQNKNITSASIKAQYERLSSDYQLRFNIYNELAKQLEQAKIKVAEDTPTFSKIQKVTVPNEKSAPKRGLIIAVFTLLGGIMGFAIVFTIKFLKDAKEKWLANQ